MLVDVHRIDTTSRMIQNQVQAESIQSMIADMKKTQHGDRTNPLYDLAKDWHSEGGVWQHTTRIIDSLPSIVKKLVEIFDDNHYRIVYEQHIHVLRAAALYHDVGKIFTQEPSTKRVGSFSFRDHSTREVIEKALAQYDVELPPDTIDLIAAHHFSLEQFEVLLDDWSDNKLKMLVILKACDSFGVGVTSIEDAIEHVTAFHSAIAKE